MPRRKGYGIPPTKRIKVDDKNENNEYEINEGPSSKAADAMQKTQIENNSKHAVNNSADTQPSHSSPINGIKYLHKKFKKMAAVLADDHFPVVTSASINNADSVTGNFVPISAARATLTPPAISGHFAAAVLTVPVTSTTATIKATAMTTPQSSLPECTRTDKLAGTQTNYVNNHKLGWATAAPISLTVAKLTAAIVPPGPSASPAVRSSDEEHSVPATVGRYACPYCKLICNKPSVLQKHIRAHTNERPYPCLPCGFAFKTRSNLYKHCRSRSHSLKLEEVGGDPQADVEEESEDEGEQGLGKAGEPGTDERTELQPRKSIYKPKFHKAAIYIQSEAGAEGQLQTIKAAATSMSTSAVSSNKLGLQLKIPSTIALVSTVQSSRSTPPTPSSFGGGSSPSPEFLQRHISKLISENQAIVETTDPFWSKKFYQRSKESCPPTPLLSSAIRKQFFGEGNYEEAKLPAAAPTESKLAHALLHPRTSRSVSMNDSSRVSSSIAEESQPLNLTVCKDAYEVKSETVGELINVGSAVELMHSSYANQVLLPQTTCMISVARRQFPENSVKENQNMATEFKRQELNDVKSNESIDSKKDLRKETAQDVELTPAMTSLIMTEVNEEFLGNPELLKKDVTSVAIQNARFVRPTSLPLKPGTFVPKKLIHGLGAISLISPETPRPHKSYGQLYIGGNAYTYLGLKCSTRSTFCTLHKSQPTYVPLSPEHNKISMYSNWKVRSEVDPYLRTVPATRAMACYDSRQRYSSYTVIYGKTKDAVTHSTYWYNRGRSRLENIDDVENDRKIINDDEKLENNSKSLKTFAGKLENSDDYTYVRGRGRGKYVCTECGIRCRKPSMLKKHTRTHTDMRPFKYIHCTFNFKTKGNLTKHMKSKAHYRKCIKLGIVPVPELVDESLVNKELLSKQAEQLDDGQDVYETMEEEDDDDDDEDEDDNEHEDDSFKQEDPKCQLEREVARSLLSLSKMSRQKVSEQYANAGLVPLNARPNTYPYSYSPVTHVSSKAHTPTLTLISEQKERETVSKNTGLARELQPGLLDKRKCNPPQNSGRYYFGSSSEKESVMASTSVIDLQESVIQDSNTVATVFPIDLSSKNVFERKTLCPVVAIEKPCIPHSLCVSNGIADILSPVSEPALLATICSTIDRLSATTTPHSDTPVATNPTDATESSAMLHTYLKERAVQDLKIKQQYQQQHQPLQEHWKVDQREFDLKYNAYNEAFQIGAAAAAVAAVAAAGNYAALSDSSEETCLTPSLKRKNHALYENEMPSVDRNKIRSDDSKENYVVAPVVESGKGKEPPSVIILVGSQNSGTANSAKKLKAEFITPHSRTLPKYGSVLEDGRSKCVVCNKVFSKPSQLRLHVNIHYFEQPFRCEACAVSFRTKGHLHKHYGSNSHLNKVNINSGHGLTSTNNPRPFKCDDCSVGFRIHGHLAKHLRSKMHIMKLECLGKLPFGTYAEMERCGINMNDIDTTDCENSLESLQRIAKGVVDSTMYVDSVSQEARMIHVENSTF